MKRLLIILAALIALIIAGVVAAYIYIDVLAKTAIERGGTYALGVNTSLNTASIKVFKAELALSGLEVANPQGFSSPHFLKLDDGDLAVTLASLRQDKVHVGNFVLAGVDVNLEKKAQQSNYQVILDNLKRFESSEKPAEAKGYVVENLEIRNVVVHVDLLGGGEITKVNVPIDAVRLKNVGSDTPRGVLLSELVGVILKAILAAAADKGGGLIPPDVLGDLKGKLAELQDLETFADVQSLGELAKPVEELGRQIKGAGEKAKQEIGKTIGDLIGGKSDQP